MEVMIGTPRAMPGDRRIDTVFEQLRARQVAREQASTYASQQEAAVKEREVNEARAIAAQQTALTASKVDIQVSQNEGEAQLQRQTRDAEAIKVTGAAEAERTRVSGQAEADRIRAVGEAEAAATKANPTRSAPGGRAAQTDRPDRRRSDAARQPAACPPDRDGWRMLCLRHRRPLMAMSLANGTVGAALQSSPDARR